MERIDLCSNRCCPTISKEGKTWIITDDYQGIVKLAEDELDNLIRIKTEYEQTIVKNQEEMIKKLSTRMIENYKDYENGLHIQS